MVAQKPKNKFQLEASLLPSTIFLSFLDVTPAAYTF